MTENQIGATGASKPATIASIETQNETQRKSEDVAQRFEALLIFTMMKSMRASLTEDSLTGSKQQDMYRQMMDREIAEQIAKSGDFGLQNLFEHQLNLGSHDTVAHTDNYLSTLSARLEHNSLPMPSGTAAMEFIARQRTLQD